MKNLCKCPYCYTEFEIDQEGSTMCMECSQRFTTVFIKEENGEITVSSIEELKKSWEKDPCWDIEETEGFEKHKNELLAWRKEYELEYQRNEEDRIARRARVVEIETGVVNSGAAQSIYTYQEIENDLDHDFVDISQVRATLLLAAQNQRIADLLEDLISNMKSDRNADDLAAIWKIKE